MPWRLVATGLMSSDENNKTTDPLSGSDKLKGKDSSIGERKRDSENGLASFQRAVKTVLFL